MTTLGNDGAQIGRWQESRPESGGRTSYGAAMSDPSIRDRLRADLLPAMKRGDKATVAALRHAIAVIDNAEAVTAGAPAPGPGEAPIAGSVHGLGEHDVADVLRGHAARLDADAAEYERIGRPEEGARLRDEGRVVRSYVGG